MGNRLIRIALNCAVFLLLASVGQSLNLGGPLALIFLILLFPATFLISNWILSHLRAR